MRISDWSSDVCSSDLEGALQGAAFAQPLSLRWIKRTISDPPRRPLAGPRYSGRKFPLPLIGPLQPQFRSDVAVEDLHLRRVEPPRGATDECNSPALRKSDRTIIGLWSISSRSPLMPLPFERQCPDTSYDQSPHSESRRQPQAERKTQRRH